MGWTLVDLPPDEGLSAFKGVNRIKGALGSFLERVKTGEIPEGSVLIFEKQDRFGRDEVDLVLTDFLSLLQSGIELFSCVDRNHYTLADIRRNPMLLNYAVMATAMANDYSKSLGGRVIKSVDIKLEKAKQGQKLSLGSWMPRWIGFDKQSGEFRFNKHADTIRRIATEYAHGKSMYQIAIELTRDKTPSLQGGRWVQGTIANLVSHQCLRGNITIKGITLKDYYPAVITQPQWETLQAKLRENRTRKGAGEHVANLFRNRCSCAHCNRTITTAKSHAHRLYTCVAKRVKRCPSKYSMRVADVEMDFFLDYLQQSPGDILRRNDTEHATKVSSVQSAIATLDKEILKITELTATLSIDELKSRLIKFETQRQTLKADLDKLNTSNLSSQNAPQAIADVLKSITMPPGGIDKTDPQYRSIKDRIIAHLSANDTRKRLLGLLPSICKGLVIDTTNKRYAVLLHNGEQSEWRSVVV